MAGPEDNRIQTLEDELKVLKGEVRRTLVDLRAFLMRADSPLTEGSQGALRRQGVPTGQNQGELQIANSARETSETVSQPAPAQPVPAQVQVAAPAPPPDAPKVIRQNLHPSLIRDTTPEWAALGYSGQQAIWGELSRRDQEEKYQEPGDKNNIRRYRQIVPEPEPRPRRSRVNVPEDEDRDYPHHSQSRSAREQRDAPSYKNGYHDQEAGTESVLRRNGSQSRSRSSLGEQISEEDREEYRQDRDEETSQRYQRIAPTPEPNVRRSRDRLQEQEDVASLRFPEGRTIRQQKNQPTSKGRYSEQEDFLDGVPPLREHSKGQSKPGNRVYDEYRQLLAESQNDRGGYPAAGAVQYEQMDLIQLASLMHWVTIAKQRLGGQGLKDLLDLYLQSGHDSPGLRALMVYLRSLAHDVPYNENYQAQESLDLMLHLHGILSGGLAIAKIP